MPVDDEINLDDPEGLTQNDIDRMSEQADELERIAYASEKNAETIKKNFDIIGKMTDEKNFKQIGALTGEAKELDLGSITNKELEEQILEIYAWMNESKEKRKKINLDLEEGKQHRMRLDSELAKGFAKFNKELNVLDVATSNPIQFAKGKLLGFIGKAGAVGAIITMVVGLVQKMWGE